MSREIEEFKHIIDNENNPFKKVPRNVERRQGGREAGHGA